MANTSNVVVGSNSTPCVYFPTTQKNPLWVNWCSIFQRVESSPGQTIPSSGDSSNQNSSKELGSLQQNWFQRICTHYSELQRHYHTLSHISELVQYYNEFEERIRD